MEQLRQALKKIEQMSDCGSPESAIVNMKSIATEALKSTPQSVEQLRAIITELTDIRNKLYNELPVGEIPETKVWDLIQMIKWHVNDLDNFMSRIESTPIEGITDEQLEKVAKLKYPLLQYKADAHNDVREDANKIIKQQQQCFIAGAKYILSHSVDRGREAVLFLDSIRDYELENGKRICHDERTSEELYQEYINQLSK